MNILRVKADILRKAIVINHEVKRGKISQHGGGGSRQNQKFPKEILYMGGSRKKIINYQAQFLILDLPPTYKPNILKFSVLESFRP